MSELVPCPECQRHVRKTETSCPFCGEALSLSHLPAAVVPTRRLGRAATFAFGASVVGATALVGCSSDADGPGNFVQHYGAPPSGAGGQAVGGTGGNGGINAGGGPVYGAPPSGATNGGNLSQGGGAQPVYGAPAAGTGNEPSGGAAGAGGDSFSAVYGAPADGGGAGGAGGAQ
jgi:hypothetical protein